MLSHSAFEAILFVPIVISLATLALLWRRNEARNYVALVALLLVRALNDVIAVSMIFHRKSFGLSPISAYSVYFYAYWTSSILQVALQIAIIYSVYRVAMKPLEGLQRIGSVIFYWVSAVSVVLSIAMALGPHLHSADYLDTALAQTQQGVSVLTLCLLLFVCFAAKPLGLTFRSRPFGVALGLGFSACASLVMSAWFSTTANQTVYSPVFACGAVISAASMLIWGVYFALPEPERRMILVPTTSPYFLWNSISAALGDNPGMVAVAGFTPAMLAPAEMAALTAGTGFEHEAGVARLPSLAPIAA